MQRKFGAITSSQNPEEIATKVKGIVLMFSAIIPFIAARFFGVTLSANDVVSLSTEIGAMAGLMATIYGTGLHILALIFKTA